MNSLPIKFPEYCPEAFIAACEQYCSMIDILVDESGRDTRIFQEGLAHRNRLHNLITSEDLRNIISRLIPNLHSEGQWYRFVFAAIFSIMDYEETRYKAFYFNHLRVVAIDSATTLLAALKALDRANWPKLSDNLPIARLLRLTQQTNGLHNRSDDDNITLSSALGSLIEELQKPFEVKSGLRAAPLVSRKRTPKTTYLRAFTHLLTSDQSEIFGSAPDEDCSPIGINSNVIHAIALSATATLHDPHLVVSADDVRKVIAQRGTAAPWKIELPKERANPLQSRRIRHIRKQP